MEFGGNVVNDEIFDNAYSANGTSSQEVEIKELLCAIASVQVQFIEQSKYIFDDVTLKELYQKVILLPLILYEV